jgi:hypothetical protein
VLWVVDLMPTASWIQLLVGLSLLNTAMAWWHAFRLWHIESALQRGVSRL